MSVLSNIEDEFIKVEHFIAAIVTDITPVIAIFNPVLAGQAKLAVDVLNALALNTSEITTQTAISTAIAAINANPSIAASVLSKINLNAVVANTSTVLTAVKSVESVIANPTQPIVNHAEVGGASSAQSPQQSSAIEHNSGDA